VKGPKSYSGLSYLKMWVHNHHQQSSHYNSALPRYLKACRSTCLLF
jgi:hypothetical protein